MPGKSTRRDPRLNATEQTHFFSSASDVRAMFDDHQARANPMLSRSGDLDGGHGLAGPSAVTSSKVDPLKLQAERAEAGFAQTAEIKKKPKTFSEHRDRLNEIYSQYLTADTSFVGKKQQKK